jgi:ribonuclease M5
MALIRSLADTRGILILTDSDAAGFLIRSYLSGCIAPDKIRHAYIPDILGKEKRKQKPSSEGKLGVEGMPVDVLKVALLRAGIGVEEERLPPVRRITKSDLFLCGLSGGPSSAQKRAVLLKKLSLPEHLSANALLKLLNGTLDYDEFIRIASEL